MGPIFSIFLLGDSPLLLNLDIALDVVANLGEVALHARSIFLVDDFEELFQLGTDLRHLVVGVGVEEDFLQQVVIFVEHTLGDAHVTLEGGTRGVLMLHDSSKDEGGDEGDAERVSNGLIVLLEGVFVDVQAQLLIEVLEENTTHIIALADDDGVLLRELLQIGEGGTEHRVRRDVAHTTLFVKFFQIGFDTRDIADDALLGQVGNDLLEDRNGVLQRDGIDEQLGLKRAYLVVCGEALTIIRETHALRVALEYGDLVVETQQVDEETSHLACT